MNNVRVEISKENQHFILDEAVKKNVTISEVVDSAITNYRLSEEAGYICNSCGEKIMIGDDMVFEGLEKYHISCWQRRQ